ncbi:hypothetical protein IGK74_002317 [Enterococcus sp. AZ150]|uniref:hypothetical protein n=1 Tax=Enterococcus sp. AZ150 TaxID=2774866 RepID=UPI003F255B84
MINKVEKHIRKIRLNEALDTINFVDKLQVFEDIQKGYLKFYDDELGRFTTYYELDQYLKGREKMYARN